eukprot:CAMPEP_0170194176 /NCGR_PEP_ID=MMETSP0040_2-20121228/58605_1 /TAXON_ID=641309 /ORGANISM="Lotharella oceanica, Strain CCMP622" /LENGTH=58 /DNA_ID=CAMNT_0010443021 /DNA_START=7 /DNA_END=179 /DNA_ORIENTATION=+
MARRRSSLFVVALAVLCAVALAACVLLGTASGPGALGQRVGRVQAGVGLGGAASAARG